jgi:hypothetical protein
MTQHILITNIWCGIDEMNLLYYTHTHSKNIMSRTIPKCEFHYKNPKNGYKKRTRRKKTNHAEPFTY